MNRFEVLYQNYYSTGFQEVITLQIDKPICDQLRRVKLDPYTLSDFKDTRTLKKIIEKNSSLRINFGWSFESLDMLETMMKECIEEVLPRYESSVGNMVSDCQCSWIGFVPFNVFDKVIYEELSADSLIRFNNELINFQIDVVEFISRYKSFRSHSLLRNDTYRFKYYKEIRHNTEKLSDAFHYYMDSIKDTSGLEIIPQGFIEESIGCHYLHHPEIFFEILNFYKLKGSISAK